VRSFLLLLLSAITLAAGAADWTWTGAVNSNWNNKSNWSTTSSSSFPQAGDTVILAAGVAKPANQNIANLSILKIVIPPGIQPATTVGGLAISLGAGGLEFQNAANDFAFSAPIVLTEQQRWSIAPNRTLTLSGAISADLAELPLSGTTSAGSKLVTDAGDTSGLVVGMPIRGITIFSTWIESIDGSTLTLTRSARFTTATSMHLRQCWILDGSGVLDISAATGENLTAPILAKSGIVRFSQPSQVNGGVILGRSTVLELRSGSGAVALSMPVVSLAALNADKTEAESPALLVHAGDTLTIPSAAGVALSLEGAGTKSVFRIPGSGHVRFLQSGLLTDLATHSLRLDGGTTSLNALSYQGESVGNGCLEFYSSATLNMIAKPDVVQTAVNGTVVSQSIPPHLFNVRYGPRQLSVYGGVANVNLAPGAVFQNDLQPVEASVLVANGATLNVNGADETSIFRLGRNASGGATSATLNLGRFDLQGGQFYIHAVPGLPPFHVLPSQAGFTLALNGGIFNGNRCDDFLGDFRINDAPVGQPRIDNFNLSGSGALQWGPGILEKINVVDDPNGHDSSQRQHILTLEKSGGSVHVAAGAKLRISAGSVAVNGINPFADDTIADRYVAIENNANLHLAGADKIFGTLSGTDTTATIQFLPVTTTSYSDVDSTYAGSFQGGNTFVKSGTGALRLTGDSSVYQGVVRVQGGTLIADNAISSTGSQTVQVGTNGTLTGSGKVVGTVDLSGTLKPGPISFSMGDNTLETGPLTVNTSSTLRFTLTNLPATGSAVVVSGDVAVNGGAVRIANGGGFTTGDYPLVTYSGTLIGNLAQLSLAEMPPGFSGILLHDSTNKAIVLRVFVPPVSNILQPALNLYRAATWPGSISGSVVDSNGVGIASVEVSVRKASGEYFDGAAFASVSEFWIPAGLNGLNWSLAFPIANIATDDAYTIRVRATDNSGNSENPPAQRSVTVDRVAPMVTVNTLATASASPALSGIVNDPSATVVVSINGSGISAQSNGGAWAVAAGSLPRMTAGVYDVVAQATDSAGNIGVDATTNELTITLPNILLL